MIAALSTRLIITQQKKSNQTTESGIILSQGTDDTTQATVVAVGPDCKQRIQPGDQVVPIWQRVHHVRINGEDLFGVDEQDIIGVIK